MPDIVSIYKTLMQKTVAALRLQTGDDSFALFLRQAVCGVGSLIVDAGFMLLCLQWNANLPLAVFAGFCIGTLFHYNFTKRYVFFYIKTFKAKTPAQFALHVLCVCVALLITQVVVNLLVVFFAVTPLAAKGISVIFVFIWTLFYTKKIVFTEKKRS